MADKIWSKVEVEFSETPSSEEAGRTDVSCGYAIFDGTQAKPACGVQAFYARLPADGVAGVKAAWAVFLTRLANRGIHVSPSGRTNLTSVRNEDVHTMHRAFAKAVNHIIEFGEENSRKRGRSVHKDKD